MEELAIGALAFAGGALVGWLAPRLRREPPPPVEPEPPHEHDWHIGGKDEGRVRYECRVPGCEEVKHG